MQYSIAATNAFPDKDVPVRSDVHYVLPAAQYIYIQLVG